MKTCLPTLVAMLAVTGCATAPTSSFDARLASDAELLSGDALFGRPVDAAAIGDPGLLELDDEMRAFVRDTIGDVSSGRERMRLLLKAMVESGLLSLDYDQEKTKTARETFHDRNGNCISFTNLFVALAREAGLDVAYQTVEIPPIWYADSDLVILNNHINALIKQKFDSRVVVDFNIAEFKGNYDSEEVSDAYATALYFNNVAMDALRVDDTEAAFRYLKKAIQTDREIAGPWVNLGVIYARNGQEALAHGAYARALEVDPDYRSALANLALLHRSRGSDEVADYYAGRIRNYQNRNPYFHYYRARQAYQDGNLDESERLLNKAMRLKKTEHQFFFLQGLIENRRGDPQAAMQSLLKARELAGYVSTRERYSEKIALLNQSS